ncbi:MAG TPA: HIT domain-containing protein [Gammaproteobacteria bacterium]|nr:HIT domain-containing protein [Gammaproteobacteria bacterium]
MFELHPQLDRDCIAIGDFPLSRLLLMDDANYPWLILVPRRDGIREIYQLSRNDQLRLIRESSYLARQLKEGLHADKINIAALGNQVAQLHIHHVVRYENDPAWPQPVWGAAPRRPYTPQVLTTMQDTLYALLTENFNLL